MLFFSHGFLIPSLTPGACPTQKRTEDSDGLIKIKQAVFQEAEGKTKKKSTQGLGFAALSPYKEIHIHRDSGLGGTGWGGVGCGGGLGC